MLCYGYYCICHCFKDSDYLTFKIDEWIRYQAVESNPISVQCICLKIQDLFISRIKVMTTDCEFDINLGISAIYDHHKPKSLSRKLKIELKSKPLNWCGVVWFFIFLVRFRFVSFSLKKIEMCNSHGVEHIECTSVNVCPRFLRSVMDKSALLIIASVNANEQ